MIWFAEGGPWMWGIALTDALLGSLLAMALLLAGISRLSPAVVWPARIATGLLLLATVLPALEGIVGWRLGLAMMEQALEHASPEHVAPMREVGEQIAAYPLWFGLGSSAVLMAFGLVDVVVAFAPGPSAPRGRGPTEL